MTEWLTAARRCDSRPGGPDRGELAVQPQCRCALRQLVGGSLIFSATLPMLLRAQALRRTPPDDERRHRTACSRDRDRKIRCIGRRSGRADRPECAGTFTCPGTASILPARRGIQKAWMTSWLDTSDVDRCAGRHMQDAFRSLLHHDRDSGTSRPTAARRLRFVRGACPGSGRSLSPAISRIGDQRQQHDSRQHQAAEHQPAFRRYTGAPAGAPDHQHEQRHDQQEENGRAGQHHPPERCDRGAPPAQRDPASIAVPCRREALRRLPSWKARRNGLR